MVLIAIPFHEDMAQAALEGRKCCTSRNQKYGKPGDVFLIRGKEFVLNEIYEEKLLIVSEVLYEMEGFLSPQGFIDKWVSIHPRLGWTPDKVVWVHVFSEAKFTQPAVF